MQRHMWRSLVAAATLTLGLISPVMVPPAVAHQAPRLAIGQVQLVASGAAALVTTTINCTGGTEELSTNVTQPQLFFHPAASVSLAVPCFGHPRTSPLVVTVCAFGNEGCPPFRPGNGIVSASYATSTGSAIATVTRRFTPVPSVDVGTAHAAFAPQGRIALNGLNAHVPVTFQCTAPSPIFVSALLVETVAWGRQVTGDLGGWQSKACTPGRHTHSLSFPLTAGHPWQPGTAFIVGTVSQGSISRSIYRTVGLVAGAPS